MKQSTGDHAGWPSSRERSISRTPAVLRNRKAENRKARWAAAFASCVPVFATVGRLRAGSEPT